MKTMRDFLKVKKSKKPKQKKAEATYSPNKNAVKLRNFSVAHQIQLFFHLVFFPESE
jgi:hypothetical protein